MGSFDEKPRKVPGAVRWPRIAEFRSVVAMVLLAGLIAATCARSAHADADRVHEAARLFDEAKALMLEHEWASACAKLEASLRLDPQLGTQLHLAHCYEQQGRTASAWRHFRSAAQLAAERNAAGQHEPREEVARARVEMLSKKLSTLNVRVADALGALSGFQVTLDGRRLRSSELNTDTPVDPGSHRVAASATGYESWTSTVYVGSNHDKASSVVPSLLQTPEPLAKERRSAQTIMGEPKDESPYPAPRLRDGDLASRDTAPGEDANVAGGETDTSPLLIASYVTGALGIIASGVGITFGIMMLRTVSERDKLCPDNVCQTQDELQRVPDLTDRAEGRATAANVSLATGGVLVAAAISMLLLAPRQSADELSIEVAASPHSAAMKLSTTF